ncbi:uracil-DNA glycosylase [Pleomassaria siparia CBS 279.74]|uniref:Uracil-DNA glycosylase n=1 Tax=Pleomassaria siparia CBS 279.74 TaxID=1314801 RepID=A0A6G1K387_9PLEO|nr:uracil-DNA glycosylase [Pleomassaria siparia CBS 279.74]
MTLKRKATEVANTANKAAKPNASITAFFGAPKPKPEAAFDKEAWVAKLSADQKELLDLEIETLHDSWLPHLKDVLVSPQFLELKRFLKKELAGSRPIYPPMKDVYSWSRHTPLNTVKVVVTGQDPYHGPNQAHGLCFSVQAPTPAPPSLKNIYIALKKDYPEFQPPPNKGGLLIPWAERGVLLINTCLTVRRGEPKSHENKGWEQLMQKVIDTVSKTRPGVVFLAWGTPAANRVKEVNQAKHLVLKSVHPSPLSASRGWFDCHHFKKTNDWLVQKHGKEAVIDWNLDSLDPETSTLASAPTKIPPPAPASAPVLAPTPQAKSVDSDDELFDGIE